MAVVVAAAAGGGAATGAGADACKGALRMRFLLGAAAPLLATLAGTSRALAGGGAGAGAARLGRSGPRGT